MKTPKFLNKLSAILTPRPKTRLRATAARAARPSMMEDYDEQEPTTKLSSAFIVVLILHVVAVGGIYAFNSIKASRRGHETTPPAQVAAKAAPAAPTTKEQPATPAASSVAENTTATVTSPAVSAKPFKQYAVKNGDNLTKIAIAFSTTKAELAAANNIKETALLHEGQMLNIPAAKVTAKTTTETAKTITATKASDVPPTKTTPGLHIVKKGDTPTSIAHIYGISAADLLTFNKITDPKKLQLGQALKLPPRK